MGESGKRKSTFIRQIWRLITSPRDDVARALIETGQVAASSQEQPSALPSLDLAKVRQVRPTYSSHDDQWILDYFAKARHSFSLDEVQSCFETERDAASVQAVIRRDARLISLSQTTDSTQYFVSKAAAYRWWMWITARARRAETAKLTSGQLALAASWLVPDKRWESIPRELLNFGCELGLIAPSFASGVYVLPLVIVIQHFPALLGNCVESILREFTWEGSDRSRLEQRARDAFKLGLDGIDSPHVHATLLREGLITGERMTLEEVGRLLGCTRERVRQREQSFRRRVCRPTKAPPFIEALLCGLMSMNARLVSEHDEPRPNPIFLVASCLGVPVTHINELGIVVIGISKDIVSSWKKLTVSPDCLDRLQHTIGLTADLSRSDARTIAESVSRLALSRKGKAGRVYLALQHIGKPAHYTEIARVYNEMFPSDISSVHNVHAVLSRETCGIVWIGLKGTFAVREWGYARPEGTIFDTIASIVESIHSQTGRPVPFHVIGAEIGKHRAFVQASSLAIATQCNPRIRRVGRDSYVPVGEAETRAADILAVSLDGVLQDFEREHSPSNR